MTGHSSDPSIDVDKQRPEAARLAERCIAYKGQVEAGAAEIARLTAALSRAREALNPFVDFSNRFGDTARDDSWQITQNPSGKGNLTMGDCRNARAALLSISEPVK